jgi:hypothetical protein
MPEFRLRDYVWECLCQIVPSWKQREAGVILVWSVVISLGAIGAYVLKVVPEWVPLVMTAAVVFFDVFVIYPFQVWRSDKQQIVRLTKDKVRREAVDQIALLRRRAIDHRAKLVEHNEFSDWYSEFERIRADVRQKIMTDFSSAEADAFEAVGVPPPDVGINADHITARAILQRDGEYLLAFIHSYTRQAS